MNINTNTGIIGTLTVSENATIAGTCTANQLNTSSNDPANALGSNLTQAIETLVSTGLSSLTVTDGLDWINPNLNEFRINFGKRLDGSCGFIKYNGGTTVSLGARGYGALQYEGGSGILSCPEADVVRVKASGNITSTGTVSAATLETTQTTPADALGSNLKQAIFEMVYPIGSIYQSFTPINNHDLEYTDANENIIVTWNNCTWKLLDSGTFVRNVTHETTSGNNYSHNIDNQTNKIIFWH